MSYCLLMFHSNIVPILHRFWDIHHRSRSKIANLNLPHFYLAPPWGWLHWNFAEILAREKSPWAISRGVVCVILCLAVLVYSAGYWQTDRQTLNDSIYRASIALRGKLFSLLNIRGARRVRVSDILKLGRTSGICVRKAQSQQQLILVTRSEGVND